MRTAKQEHNNNGMHVSLHRKIEANNILARQRVDGDITTFLEQCLFAEEA